MQGKGAESGTLRPADKEVTDPRRSFSDCATPISPRPQASEQSHRPGGHPLSLPVGQRHAAAHGTHARGSRAAPPAMPCSSSPRAPIAVRCHQPEHDDMLAFYHTLREKSGLTHEEAMRDSIVSVLMSPEFCYRVDLLDRRRPKPHRRRPRQLRSPPYALASRLSYFLWSSMPDEELLAHAAAGDLQKPDVLLAQARRMLKDDRARGLATRVRRQLARFPPLRRHTTRSIASASPASPTICARPCSRSRSASSRT